MRENETCDLWGEEDITHTPWEGKKIQTGDSCKKLEKLSRGDIPRNLKLGAPNAMQKRMDANVFCKKMNMKYIL